MQNSALRNSIAITADMALDLYRRMELRSNESTKQFECKVAKNISNLGLNRWHNVLPYDSTRVILDPPYVGKFSTDYINASYVTVKEAERCYILTQGPLPETIWHFWTMVYQVQSQSIVMLCRLSEGGICKCARYWPEDHDRDPVSGMELFLLSEEIIHDIVIRKIELRHPASKVIRVVTQYHYNKWPDFGVPTEPTTFLRLLETVSTQHPSVKSSPSIVHCSAGIGRSGTFCLVDSCCQIMNKRHGPMTRQEILDVLHEMRLCRSGLVQTPEQLRFSLYAISVAMAGISFNSETPVINGCHQDHHMNGIKQDSENGDKQLDNDSDQSSASQIISDDNDNNTTINREDGRQAAIMKHTRKRSTTTSDEDHQDWPQVPMATSVDIERAARDDSTEGNGQSQAKRPKSTPADFKDW